MTTGQTELYFQKTNGSGLSAEFKDLILSLFSYDGAKRPSISQIRQHPWLNKPGFNMEATRKGLLAELSQKKPMEDSAKPMTKPAKVNRKHTVAQ